MGYSDRRDYYRLQISWNRTRTAAGYGAILFAIQLRSYVFISVLIRQRWYSPFICDFIFTLASMVIVTSG